MTKEKYIIRCPNCNTQFDVSEQLEIWKKELFKKIERIVKELKELKDEK